MAEHNIIGQKGEQIAQQFLSKSGYKIIETNWRIHKCEIDVIAHHEKFLCIVEVKTRTSNNSGDPRDAINKKKKQELIKAANFYLETIQGNPEIRFDVVEVILQDQNYPKINLIKDAFNAVG